MATVDWKAPAEKTYRDGVPYTFNGFDFRKVILDNVWRKSEESTSAFSGTSVSPHRPGIVKDTYQGSFILQSNTYIVDGTVTSFTRYNSEQYAGSITALTIPYKTLLNASETPDKADDIALFREAFAGDDVLSGGNSNDRLEGFAGQDVIRGGRGSDKLYGGGGADRFVYAAGQDSANSVKKRDVIYDFSKREGDKIDLSLIDANSTKGGNQAFKYIGRRDFQKKAGELRYEKVKGSSYVYGDINGDGKADLTILIKGAATMPKGYFIL
ncbi:calcium-binding protein [Microvirga lenta]|uniref:calcium-binding protein n=1 Tax=Microvirga lenta TaxID=2881337 RepID=UPI001CFFD8E8|nr:hypothetical protein [Microvirga lenta]MCB5176852.1 hypothetical protein [Microvirga lenta]